MKYDRIDLSAINEKPGFNPSSIGSKVLWWFWTWLLSFKFLSQTGFILSTPLRFNMDTVPKTNGLANVQYIAPFKYGTAFFFIFFGILGYILGESSGM